MALNVWIEGRKQGGGLHEVDEAEVLAKGQIQYTASHRHELPAARANVSAAASCKTGGVKTLDGTKSQSITCLQQVRTGS